MQHPHVTPVLISDQRHHADVRMAANVGWKGTMIAPATMAATALFERILAFIRAGNRQ
jgi:hypothetical protein